MNNPPTKHKSNLFNQAIKLIKSTRYFVKKNAGLYLAFLFALGTLNIVSAFVSTVEFLAILKPKTDNNNYKIGWILVKVTGTEIVSYEPYEQVEGFARHLPFLWDAPDAKSRFWSMIYTDSPTGSLDSGISNQYDVSVLVNKDITEKSLTTKPPAGIYAARKEKINSQTFQSRLMRAHETKEPVCILVYGVRDNKKSRFLDILDVEGVSEEIKTKYNQLPDYQDKKRVNEIGKLTQEACTKHPRKYLP